MGEIFPWRYYMRGGKKAPGVDYWETPCVVLDREPTSTHYDQVVKLTGFRSVEVGLSRLLIKRAAWKQRATIAHELGHVAATEGYLRRRGYDYLSDEWRSELSADWFADCRWGFSDEIRRDYKHRQFVHHLAGPCTEFGENGILYRINEDYTVKKIGKYDE